ncbi:hypothetical protein [Methylobacterium nodulans]|uniref:Uncharacterized protein n=1 Tax=Methylobacterium nodulans (strain LMG 21967 / CNCM I-2342 / ORS 2060) TaxID=460265 RepID=B8IDR6_METNO|nr:hypothetical protein [Methylobacterium nodulans]ACL55638.1 hypothetical protein Mnod_0601 [Methylobacterium nodulans ORS 2060]
MRKRIGIEDFLRWAYRDELPKVQAEGALEGPAGYGGPWGGVLQVGTLGTRVDATENRYGVVPDRYARDDAHPDAILAAEAVQALDACTFDLPEGWNPIRDLGDLGALGTAAVGQGVAALTHIDAEGARRLRAAHTPAALVRRYALLGGCPIWEGDKPVVRLVLGANGKPAWFRRETIMGEAGPYEIEVNGMGKRGYPLPDAYQKPYLDPCPVDTIVGRGQYELWRSALDLLCEDLRDHLTGYALEPCDRPIRPWETGDRPKRRVIHSRLMVVAPLRAPPPRPRGRAPRHNSPVHHVTYASA